MKLDIKTLIILLTIAATMGGFYYSTEVRLAHLENKVSELQSSITGFHKQVKRLSRIVNKQEKI
jgi:hypothetical protein